MAPTAVGALVGDAVGTSVLIVHSRSDTCDGDWLSYSRAATHAVKVLQNRLEVSEGAAPSNSELKSHSVIASQDRSEFTVGASVSNSELSQARRATQIESPAVAAELLL